MITKSELNELLLENPFLVISDILYNSMYDDIITLKITPGDKLSESKIADALEISRTPVRSALMKLMDDNLIEKKDGKASVVSPMRKEVSRSLFDARLAIEGYSANLAAQRITQKQLHELKKIAISFRDNIANMDTNGFARCDHEFHSYIINVANNDHITRMYKSIEKSIIHYRYCLVNEVEHDSLRAIIVKSANLHEAIYNALSMRFSDVAQREIERDIMGMLDAFSSWK